MDTVTTTGNALVNHTADMQKVTLPPKKGHKQSPAQNKTTKLEETSLSPITVQNQMQPDILCFFFNLQ